METIIYYQDIHASEILYARRIYDTRSFIVSVVNYINIIVFELFNYFNQTFINCLTIVTVTIDALLVMIVSEDNMIVLIVSLYSTNCIVYNCTIVRPDKATIHLLSKWPG